MINIIVFISLAGFLLFAGYTMRHVMSLAQNPKPQLEIPQNDARIKLLIKTFLRWKEEGNITREEFEKLLSLCRAETNLDDESRLKSVLKQ